MMEAVHAGAVLVGVLDQRILEPGAVSWDTSKVGGLPTWFDSESSWTVPECKGCGQASSLVSQIYCPLGGSLYHRCVYLFVCPGRCSRQQNGWSVFRAMTPDSSYRPDVEHAKTSTHPASNCLDEIWDKAQNDWGDDANDWGDDCEGEHQRSCEDVMEKAKDFACRQAGSSSILAASLVAANNHVAELEPENDALDICVSDSPHLLQSLESLSKLTLSDDVVQSSECSSADGGKEELNAEGALAVETLGLADAQRWDAMAKLLNTKLGQGLKTATSKPQSCVTFEPYFLSVMEEPADETIECGHLNDLIRSYEKSEGKQLRLLMSDSPKTSKEKDRPHENYERTELKHGDKMFHKFHKRLQRCPQQCIRYDRGGDPLLVSRLSEEPVNRCPYCQGKRIFEFQLLPQLIPFLRAEGDTPCEVEFGTVLVFTCERNCWPADLDPDCKLDLLEEYIILQGDPDIHLYR